MEYLKSQESDQTKPTEPAAPATGQPTVKPSAVEPAISDKELAEQPSTLVEEQLKARKARKEQRLAKELKLPWYKKALMGRLSMNDKIFFLDNLATMLKAGLALAPALKTMSEEMKNKYFKAVLKHLIQRVENGELLSQGMKQYPKVFPEMMIATIEVGESSGLLDETLGQIAEIMKAEKTMRSKVFSALMYPSVVLVALILVSLILTFFVFPQLVGIFEEAHVRLPIILIIVQTIIRVVTNYGWYVLGGGLAFITLVVMILRQPKPKLWLHTNVLKLPFAGGIIREIALTRFAGNLKVLLASGLPIVKALNIIAKSVGNLRYRQTILEMSQELEKGVALYASMKERPHLFPSLMIQLCQVGEETGELESILGKVSDFYDGRVNSVLNNLSVIIEPVLLVLVGLAVGFIAVSVIGPIYELTNSFGEG